MENCPILRPHSSRPNDNHVHRERDPTGHCHMHGVPRSLVPPFPTEIVEDSNYVVLISETEHSVRIIPFDGRPHLKHHHAWVGDSRGRWEGDTLVVDVTGFNGRTWLDQSGNFVDENEHVVERFTMMSPDAIVYEARVEDSKLYFRPWTLRVSLRRQPKGAELIEYDSIEGERDEIHFPGAAKSLVRFGFGVVFTAASGWPKAPEPISVASGWLRAMQTRTSSAHT